MQWLLILVAVALSVAITSWFYLSLSAQSVALGRQIRQFNKDKLELTRDIEDLRNRIALASTEKVMAERAAKLGFTIIAPETVDYLVVDGYLGRSSTKLANALPASSAQSFYSNPEFTQSLWEWLYDNTLKLGAQANKQ